MKCANKFKMVKMLTYFFLGDENEIGKAKSEKNSLKVRFTSHYTQIFDI